MEAKLNPRLAYLALALTLIVYTFNFFAFNRATAPTYDEGVHLAAGYRILQCGNYAINPEHPPLAKAMAAWPIRGQSVPQLASNCATDAFNKDQSFSIASQILISPAGDQDIHLARVPLLLFPLLLIVVLFFAVRSWFGPLAACIAVLLLTFEPVVTAYGSLITTDLPVTAAMFSATACTYLWLRRPDVLSTFLLGLAFGLSVTTKHSGILVPLFSLAVLQLSLALKVSDVPYRRVIVSWSIASAIAFALLWAAYGFCFYATPAAHGITFDVALPAPLQFALNYHLLPESYLAGFADILNNSTGLFLLGHFYATGQWFYYPVAIAIKTTLPLLLLAIASIPILRILWRKDARAVLALLIPPICYLAISSMTEFNVGVRHALPVYPFAIALAAAAAVVLIQRWRSAIAVVAMLILWQATAFMANRTELTSYANELFGGPAHLYERMNVDWGQAAYLVEDWAARHPNDPCLLVWYAPTFPRTHCTFTDNTWSGRLELEPPLVAQHFRGTVLISDVAYHDPDLPFLRTLPSKPSGLIEGSILVFSGDFDLSPVAANQHRLRALWLLRHGHPAEALNECALVDPRFVEPAALNFVTGVTLHALGRDTEARAKLTEAAALATRDPKLRNIRVGSEALLRELH